MYAVWLSNLLPGTVEHYVICPREILEEPFYHKTSSHYAILFQVIHILQIQEP